MKYYNQKNKDFIFIIIICISIIVVYSFSINYPIFNDWDDQYYILNNKYLTFNLDNISHLLTNSYYHMYHPLTMLSYMIDFNIWGYNSIGYHLQNILWHMVTCIFIYKCFRLLKINQFITFTIDLIFSIHPQRVESAVWLSERKDVLCSAFYFMAIYLYIKHSNIHNKFSIAAFAIYLCAFLSKPMAMSIPFILLFFEYYKYRKIELKYYFNRLWLYFFTLFFFVIIAFMHQAKADSKFILLKQIYTVLYNIIWYVQKTFFPIFLNPIYPKTDIDGTIIYLLIIYISATLNFEVQF
jgi:protein O-mannosyl-transferase